MQQSGGPKYQSQWQFSLLQWSWGLYALICTRNGKPLKTLSSRVRDLSKNCQQRYSGKAFGTWCEFVWNWNMNSTGFVVINNFTLPIHYTTGDFTWHGCHILRCNTRGQLEPHSPITTLFYTLVQWCHSRVHGIASIMLALASSNTLGNSFLASCPVLVCQEGNRLNQKSWSEPMGAKREKKLPLSLKMTKMRHDYKPNTKHVICQLFPTRCGVLDFWKFRFWTCICFQFKTQEVIIFNA